MNIQDQFPLGWTGWISLQSKGLARVLSKTQFKSTIYLCLAFFIVQLSHPYMTAGKIIALTRRTFVGKVMSLFFNMLFRLVISFFSMEKASFNFMAAITICSDFGAQENKVCHCFHCFPHLFAMIFIFWMLSFKPASSLSSFTFIKRLFSSSSLCAIRVVLSAYLRLLIFLQAILIPACASSSPAFRILYSAYKLNKHSNNIQPWHTPFPIWNQSVVPCPVLTVALDLHTDFSEGR